MLALMSCGTVVQHRSESSEGSGTWEDWHNGPMVHHPWHRARKGEHDKVIGTQTHVECLNKLVLKQLRMLHYSVYFSCHTVQHFNLSPTLRHRRRHAWHPT